MYTNRVFGTATYAIQGVLIREVPLYKVGWLMMRSLSLIPRLTGNETGVSHHLLLWLPFPVKQGGQEKMCFPKFYPLSQVTKQMIRNLIQQFYK